MKSGIVGADNIGGVLACPLTQLGHRITVADSRGPEALGDVATATGPRPAPRRCHVEVGTPQGRMVVR